MFLKVLKHILLCERLFLHTEYTNHTNQVCLWEKKKKEAKIPFEKRYTESLCVALLYSFM